MKKPLKTEVIKVISDLRLKGYTLEELGVALGRTSNTVWRWGSATFPESIPAKSDYEVLKRMSITK